MRDVCFFVKAKIFYAYVSRVRRPGTLPGGDSMTRQWDIFLTKALIK